MPNPNNPITPDQYYIVTPAAAFISKAYGDLAGADLFFYVDPFNTLRVVSFNTNQVGNISYTLATDAKWVGVVSLADATHVYYADLAGNIWHIPYTRFGGPTAAVMLTMGSALTFSVAFIPQSNPAAFMMLTDDGVKHHVFVATDAGFTALLAPDTVVYNNTLDQTIYVTHPALSMHPADTTNVTVTCQQLTIPGNVSSVGFYEFAAPGVS